MRNSTFKQEDSDSDSLLHKVWKHYRSNELADMVDPCLRDHEFPAKEVSNVLQIGLLCTQASVTLRPSMAEVVLMLTANKERDIPIPNQPPFLNATTLEQASSIRSNSENSFVSNTLTKVETSSRWSLPAPLVWIIRVMYQLTLAEVAGFPRLKHVKKSMLGGQVSMQKCRTREITGIQNRKIFRFLVLCLVHTLVCHVYIEWKRTHYFSFI
ncbi:putative non-specific serine/threonine protein kinase [Rosa chinensis]|uniref:Putative non-specific serine/threonine protein kinase n=1 Tax=Rosa chinensis TaxID=74649 RepID=A0A2P6RJ87_ROSCH|nr:putative non-specific serine/threonine protein kinase [Rosa chinensis]